MSSIIVQVECHDPKGLSKSFYNFGRKSDSFSYMEPQKYVDTFNALQSRLQDISMEIDVQISVEANPGPGPEFPSKLESLTGASGKAEEGWFVPKKKLMKDEVRSAVGGVRYPRIGAFEVVVVKSGDGLETLPKHFKAFSKIATGKWPKMEWLCSGRKQVLEAARDNNALKVQRIVGRLKDVCESRPDAPPEARAPSPPHSGPFLTRVTHDSKHSGKCAARPSGAARAAAARHTRPDNGLGAPPQGGGFARYPAPPRSAKPRPAPPGNSQPHRPQSATEPRFMHQQHEALRTAMLEGSWRRSSPEAQDQECILIENGQIKWLDSASRGTWMLRTHGSDMFSAEDASGAIYHASLVDSELRWHSGDVWVRDIEAGRTMLPADQQVGVDDTKLTTEELIEQQSRLFLQEAYEMDLDLDEEGVTPRPRAIPPHKECPELQELVRLLVEKHGIEAQPYDIISQLRKVPPMEESLDKDRFKAPLYGLGVMATKPYNLNGLFSELASGSPPTCSMKLLAEALAERWPTEEEEEEEPHVEAPGPEAPGAEPRDVEEPAAGEPTPKEPTPAAEEQEEEGEYSDDAFDADEEDDDTKEKKSAPGNPTAPAPQLEASRGPSKSADPGRGAPPEPPAQDEADKEYEDDDEFEDDDADVDADDLGLEVEGAGTSARTPAAPASTPPTTKPISRPDSCPSTRAPAASGKLKEEEDEDYEEEFEGDEGDEAEEYASDKEDDAPTSSRQSSAPPAKRSATVEIEEAEASYTDSEHDDPAPHAKAASPAAKAAPPARRDVDDGSGSDGTAEDQDREEILSVASDG